MVMSKGATCEVNCRLDTMPRLARPTLNESQLIQANLGINVIFTSFDEDGCGPVVEYDAAVDGGESDDIDDEMRRMLLPAAVVVVDVDDGDGGDDDASGDSGTKDRATRWSCPKARPVK